MFIYGDEYDLGWATHVFPTDKYRRVYEAIISEGIAGPQDICPPRPATKEELLLVHTQEYLDELESITRTPNLAVLRFEAPLERKTLDAIYAATGGSIIAVTEAVRRGEVWVNIGGGFHHAYPGHGEGFCFINDIAVAIRSAQKAGLLKSVLVVDCDLHQGNGTAKIFENDDTVFTLSIHQEYLYPVKEKSNLDIGLDNYTGDDEYLALLEDGIEKALAGRKYDLLFYVAGADPFSRDQLGNLELSKEGLKKRDRLVLSTAERLSLPVTAVLAGGYAEDTQDVVDIHVELCRQVKAANEKRHSITF
jgi:acetoin utilization deacetylase AcuC-like enzyme